jgi:hypothetical protein
MTPRNGVFTPGAVGQRTHHQITGEPMKFLTLAVWTGMVENRPPRQSKK